MTVIRQRTWRSRVRRFAPERGAWLRRSVPLYWRRRPTMPRTIVRSVRAGEAPASSSPTFVSIHQHLHPAPRLIRMSAADRSEPAVRVMPGSTTLVTRVTDRITSERWIHARSLDAAHAAASPRPPWANVPMAIVSRPHAKANSDPHVEASARRHSRTTHDAEHTPAHRRAAPMPSLDPSTPDAPRLADTAFPARSARSRTRLLATAEQRRADARRPLVLEHAAAPAGRRAIGSPVVVAPADAPRTRPASAVVMDWRQPQAAAIERAALNTGTAAAADVRVAPAPPSSAPAATVPPTSASRENAAPVFDAAALDRLVDTVMQRIERRVRIERERRGL